jgi:hypothetical protein
MDMMRNAQMKSGLKTKAHGLRIAPITTAKELFLKGPLREAGCRAKILFAIRKRSR